MSMAGQGTGGINTDEEDNTAAGKGGQGKTEMNSDE